MFCSSLGAALSRGRRHAADGDEDSARRALGAEIRKAVELSSTFPGYEWNQWNRQNLSSLGTLFPVLLGAGGLFTFGAGGGGFYTLALPISRRRMLTVRAVTGLVQVLALALLSFLVIPLAAPAVGASYSFIDALVYAGCASVAGSVLFSLTLLMTTMFSDLWRPLLVGLGFGALVGTAELFLHDTLKFGLYRTMNAETYFQTGELPWLGLIACAVGSAAMIYAAVINLERRDF